ncbi:MAG: EamA family transporter RarD, partial [Pseudomonadota bacterium]
VAGLAAYVFWGVFPVYFKLIDTVPPTEVLLHRIVWSVPVGAAILSIRSQWRELLEALRRPRVLAWLTLSAFVISGNWFLYIWAVINDRIFETSLGYYINPLIYVLAGVVFFRERLRRAQLAAVVFATIGVLILTIQGGSLPWVSLSLAVLFTAYGVIRKQVAIGAMPGLFAETTLLFPMAFVGLVWLMLDQRAYFPAQDSTANALLLLAGPVTVVPLLFFAVAARRLSLTTVGFMQFLAPTLQFMTGLYYGEQLTAAHLVCFAFIWLAVALFSYDAILAGRRQRRAWDNA